MANSSGSTANQRTIDSPDVDTGTVDTGTPDINGDVPEHVFDTDQTDRGGPTVGRYDAAGPMEEVVVRGVSLLRLKVQPGSGFIFTTSYFDLQSRDSGRANRRNENIAAGTLGSAACILYKVTCQGAIRGVAVGGVINYRQGEAFFDSAATSAIVGGALGKVFDAYNRAAGNHKLIERLNGIKGDVIGFGLNP